MCDNEKHPSIGSIGDAAEGAIKQMNVMETRFGQNFFKADQTALEKLTEIKNLASDFVLLVFVHTKLRDCQGRNRAKRAAAIREMRKTLVNKELAARLPDGMDDVINFWVANGEIETYKQGAPAEE